MKITNILASGKLSLSFEVFPPKNNTLFDSVRRATEEIAALSVVLVIDACIDAQRRN